MKLSRREWLSLAAGWGAARRLKGDPAAPPLFEEVPPAESGIAWVHDNARSKEHYLPEALGPGCAFLDYDNDGWMDIYLVNSGPCDFFHPSKALRNALYRNNRDGTFTDVTEKAGVGGGTFGMGVAVGDYDNDGWPDIFVTSYGNCILYRNNRDGTFSDVTRKAGLETPGWTTSAVWFDYDNDGRLDLFVCSFVDYGGAAHRNCGENQLGRHYYCIPRFFKPTASFLYHNNGDGTFREVREGTDIARSLGKGLGVVATDINNDGLMDLFVANDTVQNFLFVNRGPEKAPGSRGGRWKFEEMALPAEVAFSAAGQPRSGMGVDAADYDQDGWIDLFEANVDHEMYSLYHNDGTEAFSDVANPTGLGAATRMMRGRGLKFFDYDNDGDLDLMLCNGHPDDSVDKRVEGVKFLEPLMLFHNTGKGFENVSPRSGPVFSKPLSGRGLALGDFDNDGSVDVLVAQNNAAPVLLHNNIGRQNHWLGVRLVGTKANIDAVGAKITYQSGDLKRHQFKVGGGSYLSSHDPRIVLGLGKRPKIDWLEIQWPQPSGKTERFAELPIDRYITIVEGQGKWK